MSACATFYHLTIMSQVRLRCILSTFRFVILRFAVLFYLCMFELKSRPCCDWGCRQELRLSGGWPTKYLAWRSLGQRLTILAQANIKDHLNWSAVHHTSEISATSISPHQSLASYSSSRIPPWRQVQQSTSQFLRHRYRTSDPCVVVGLSTSLQVFSETIIHLDATCFRADDLFPCW